MFLANNPGYMRRKLVGPEAERSQATSSTFLTKRLDNFELPMCQELRLSSNISGVARFSLDIFNMGAVLAQ